MVLNLKALYSLNLRERVIIAAAALLAVSYAVYALIIPPALLHYRIARRQLSVQQQLIKSREKKYKELLNLEKSFYDLEKRSAILREKFFNDEEIPDLLKDLEKMAVDSGNDLKELKPLAVQVLQESLLDKGRQKLYYKKDVVEVVVHGGYNNILNYFKRLADYQKLLGVEQVELLPFSKEGPKLKAGFILNIYILDKKDSK